MTDLLTYLERVTNASSTETLWALHREAMSAYGFDRLIYGFTRYRSGRSLGDPQDWVLLTNQPKDYMNALIEGGLYFDAPMVRWALAHDGACSWASVEAVAACGGYSPAELRVIDFNRRQGVVAGYTVSFRSVTERFKGGIALIAAPGTSQAQVDALWAEHGAQIVVMNNVVHLKLMTLPHIGARRLTARQREVLQWVGDGKTAADIGFLMSLTPATIEKHLRLARETLDVTTTAQAVLKAAFYNQMFVLDA